MPFLDDARQPEEVEPREARQEPWGLHELHITDPDGVTLIFVQIPANHPLRRDGRALPD